MNCVVCDTSIPARKGPGRPKLYCSPGCAKAGRLQVVMLVDGRPRECLCRGYRDCRRCSGFVPCADVNRAGVCFDCRHRRNTIWRPDWRPSDELAAVPRNQNRGW